MFSAPGMLIDGRLYETETTIDVVNPATGKIEAKAPSASVVDVNTAISAAAAAQPAWAALSWDQRADALRALATAIRAGREAILQAVAMELGRPFEEVGYEPDVCADMLESFLDLRLEPEVIEDSAARRAVLHFVPIGVVAAIGSWNAPSIIVTQKVGPALLAGNAVIYKPSPFTPLSALVIGAIAQHVLPAGVLNIVTGGDEVGQMLTTHPAISKVSFTGSTATGRAIMAAGATTLKRLTLELGGHSAAIVLPDAHPGTIAPKLFSGAFLNNGQICTALRRLYVPRSLFAATREALVELAKGVPLAPIQNRPQFELVCEMVADALATGAAPACGGAPGSGPGFHFPITILSDVTGVARLAREECFGPVLCMYAYDNLGDAVAAANSTEFGLGASIWSNDADAIAEVASQLEAGTIWVNVHADVRPMLPMAPAKQSGFGVEFTRLGLEELVQRKLVHVSRA